MAVQDKGLDFAKALAGRVLSSEDAALRQSTLVAISRAEDPAIATWFLRDFQDPRLRAFERSQTFPGFLGSAATRDQAAESLLADFDKFSSGTGGIFASRSAGAFDVLCTAAQADTVDARLRPQFTGGSTLNLDRAVRDDPQLRALPRSQGGGSERGGDGGVVSRLSESAHIGRRP